MTERKFKIEPKHPNSNIHGVVGNRGEKVCLTQKGIMCTGCCFLRITPLNSDTPVLKEEGVYCRHAVPKSGCGHLLPGGSQNGRWDRCWGYHCSDDRKILKGSNTSDEDKNAAYQRLYISNSSALQLKEITKAEYRENLTFRIGDPPIKVNLNTDDWYSPDKDNADTIAERLIQEQRRK